MLSLENRLRAVAFVAGFSMMAFELVAARLLAPTIGNSTYTWTCVIGVIMAALSIGYYLGGRLADWRSRLVDVAFLCQAAAGLIIVTIFAQFSFTSFLAENVADQRVQGLLASLVLFAPVSIVLGMISPYLVKLASRSLDTLGRTAAGLSTWNAIGSIAGTFITGFVLFAYVGSLQTLTAVVVVLLLASWSVAVRQHWQVKAIISVILLVIAANISTLSNTANPVNIDSASANYRIYSQPTGDNSEKTVYLVTSPRGAQSAVYSGEPARLLFWYTQEFARLGEKIRPDSHILVLGGGTFTVPRHLAEKYPGAVVDVVEIDPELERIAREYFYFERPANLNLYFEDARAFVNKTGQKYDLILVDVYNGVIIPWQFTTVEYTARLAEILSPDGLVAMNVIASSEGRCRPILEAINAAHAAQFSERRFKADASNHNDSKNMILLYAHHELAIDGYERLNGAAGQAPFTDNFAPIEPLQLECGL